MFKSHSVLRMLVMFVKRITARGHSRARRRRTIAERAAHLLSLQLATANHIQRKPWVGKHHSPQSHAIDPAFAHRSLGNVRQKILQIGVSRADHNHIWELLLEGTCYLHLLSDAEQRIFRWKVSVRRREKCRALQMRIVVRAATRNVHEANV